MPNAAVTVTNVNTNAAQRVLTGPDGSFSVSGLAPGTYQVEVEAAGFKRTTQSNIELLAGGGAVTLNLAVEPGSPTQSVNIEAHTSAVVMDGGVMTLPLTTRTVQELPLIDRNHQQLSNLQTGVTPPVVRFPLAADPARQREWNTNGQPYYANMPETVGVSNWEPMRGTATNVVPLESIQTLRFDGANYPEREGFATGSINNAVTRTGTNDLHGSLFEFHSDNAMHARSPFNVAGNPDARYTYNQFGASLAGPIVRDHIFFFGTWEGTYNRGENTTVSTVPTAAMLGGNFSGIGGLQLFNPASGALTGAGRTAYTNGIIPQSAFSPTARALLPYIPQPNQPGLANNLVSNVPYSNDWQRFDGRIDDRLTDSTAAFLRYGYTNSHATQNSIFASNLGNGDAGRNVAQNAVAGITKTIGVSTVGDARLSFNRYVLREFPMGTQAPIGAALNIPNAPAQFLPTFDIGGTLSLGSLATSPQTGIDNTYQFSTGWSMRLGMNNIKFGVDIQHYRTDGFNNLYFGPLGTAAFGPGATLAANLNPALYGTNNLFPNSFAAFLLGSPTATGNTLFTTTPTARQTWYAGWIGDSITLARIVNIDVGLRYEVYSPITPRHEGGAEVFLPDSNTIGAVGQNWAYTPRYDLHNFAPRFGIAVRVTPKTVVRGGYGITYAPTPIQFSGYMPPMTGAFAGISNGFTTVPGFTPSTFPGLMTTPAAPTNATAMNGPLNIVNYPNRVDQIPSIQQFNAQVEQEFTDGIVLSLGYQGELGRHLLYNDELNQGLPGSGLAGLPFIASGRTASTTAYNYGLNSSYNALQVSLRKRMRHGIEFQGSYTFSKALGYTTETGMLLNPTDLRANYGPADYDRQHMLTISHVIDLPFGTGTNHLNSGIIGNILGNWELNGVFTWATGTPFSVFANPLFFGGPNGTVLANVNGPVNITNQMGVGQSFFNTAAFSLPAVGAFGNQGRNSFRGPGFTNYNLALFKTFKAMEHLKVELRGEAYNIANSPHFANPQANLNAGGFGTINSLGGGVDSLGRQIDVAIRIVF